MFLLVTLCFTSADSEYVFVLIPDCISLAALFILMADSGLSVLIPPGLLPFFITSHCLFLAPLVTALATCFFFLPVAVSALFPAVPLGVLLSAVQANVHTVEQEHVRPANRKTSGNVVAATVPLSPVCTEAGSLP